MPVGNFYAVLSCLGTLVYGQLGWRFCGFAVSVTKLGIATVPSVHSKT